jgi:hypothetical protein
MWNPLRARTHFVSISIIALTLVPPLGGCVEDEPEPVDERSLEGAVVTHCGTKTVLQEDGTTREAPIAHYFDHMNNQLDRDPALRAHVGLYQVSTCEEAEQFARAELAYREANPTDEASLIPSHDDARPASEDEAFRIYHGEAVQKPGVVQIYGGCTGTFITERHILTAAHCFDSIGGGAKTDIPIFEENGSSDYSATRDGFVHIHPDYTSSGTDTPDDIAIISLWNDLPWTPTPHRFFTGDTQTGVDLHIYGYGRYNDDPISSGVLREGDNHATININLNWSGYFRASAHTARGCLGDSGGPAIHQLQGYQQPIWGVYTWMESGPCPDENDHMRWTKTNEKKGWIAARLAENLDGDFTCTEYSYGPDPSDDFYYYKCFGN